MRGEDTETGTGVRTCGTTAGLAVDDQIARWPAQQPKHRARDEQRPEPEYSDGTVCLNAPSDGAPMRSAAGRLTSGGRRGRRRFELRVRLEDPVAHGVLRRLVDDRPQEREAPALAVHGVRPRRERDVPAVAAA